MTVAELIAVLQGCPQDAEVILQKDSEGNGYSPLSDVDANAIYRPHNTWSGEVVSTDWSAEDAMFESEAQWQAHKVRNPRCCVLAPVN